MSVLRFLALATALLALVSCSNDLARLIGGGDDQPDIDEVEACQDLGLSGCGDACVATAECGAGKYCNNDNQCVAACTEDNLSFCAPNSQCTENGRCEPKPGAGGPGNECDDDPIDPSFTVPNVIFVVDRSGSMVSAAPGEMIDEGDSLSEKCDKSRWTVAHDAIVAVVNEQKQREDAGFAALVNFGLSDYFWSDSHAEINSIPVSECAVVGPASTFDPGTLAVMGNPSFIAPDSDNLDDFENDAIYPRHYPSLGADCSVGAGGDTPTGDALMQMVAYVQGDPVLSDPSQANVFVLATDGQPDTCACPAANDASSVWADCHDPENPEHPDSCTWDPMTFQYTTSECNDFAAAMAEGAEDSSVAAVVAAKAAGIKTFVLGIGLSVASDHLQELACEGDPDIAVCPDHTVEEKFFRPGDAQALADAFAEISSGEISCDIALGRTVIDPADACKSTFELLHISDDDLNQILACNPADGNGWRLKSGTNDVAELIGDACDDWRTGQFTIQGSFECDVSSE